MTLHTPSPAVLAWDQWLRQQTDRDDPVGTVARDYLDFCARRGRPASAGLMRVMVESEGTRQEFAALKQAWEEFVAAVPQPDPQPVVPADDRDPWAAWRPLEGQPIRWVSTELIEAPDGVPLAVKPTTEYEGTLTLPAAPARHDHPDQEDPR